MPSWKKQKLKLKDDHVWRAKPRHKIFIADRGAVRFDIPASWVIVSDAQVIKLYDKQPPDDDCAISVTIFHLPPADWSGLPLLSMFEQVTADDHELEVISKGEIQQILRDGLEVVWREMHFIDPKEKREAISRVSTARRLLVQAVITLDFWATDLKRGDRVWQTMLDTLTLSEYVQDPTTGR